MHKLLIGPDRGRSEELQRKDLLQGGLAPHNKPPLVS